LFSEKKKKKKKKKRKGEVRQEIKKSFQFVSTLPLSEKLLFTPLKSNFVTKTFPRQENALPSSVTQSSWNTLAHTIGAFFVSFSAKDHQSVRVKNQRKGSHVFYLFIFFIGTLKRNYKLTFRFKEKKITTN
jgi:hypothetical protein